MSLRLYKASAGSGKTYQMAIEMVLLLLENPENYQKSLAITFTNKAAEELKTRIVFVLSLLGQLKDDAGYLDKIRELSQLDDNEIQEKARTALSLILHDYSRFSISTIDKFFNRILTGFSYEVNVRPDSEISLDTESNREEAVDEMLSDFQIDTDLGKWLLQYSRQKMDDSKDWNIRSSIIKESAAISQEDFLRKEKELRDVESDKKVLVQYRNTMMGLVHKHEKAMKALAEETQQLLDQSIYDVSDFQYGMKGAVGHVLNLKIEPFREVKVRPRQVYDDAQKFLTKAKQSDASLMDFAVSKLHPVLVKVLDYYDEALYEYNTAKLVLKHINDFGVFLDVNNHLRKLCQDRNIYFPFQMSQLLHEIVVRENALFVYEKIGTRYLHFMLDEFQDTSRMQWDVLLPLLEEALAHGGNVLVVGDVKQSIYRWRNSDWNILAKEVESRLSSAESIALDVNYRSCKHIVRFNNQLIQTLVPLFENSISANYLETEDKPNLHHLYADSVQHPKDDKQPYGYIQLHLLSEDEEDKKVWRKDALNGMLDEMKRLMDLGYSAGDMAVLTRTNSEAGEIALHLMDAGQKEENSSYHFPLVSASSLYLKDHPVINCLLSAFMHIADPNNLLALNQLTFSYQRDILGNKAYQPQPASQDKEAIRQALLEGLPKSYRQQYDHLSAYPLFDLTENLILFFSLHEKSQYYAYLSAFQDQINGFSQRNSADISAFVEWFDTKNPSLDLPESSDAITISTVHKAKGLQYRFLFIPFLNWIIDDTKKPTTLWIEPQSKPFDAMPLLKVDYNSAMLDSYFRPSYQDEYYKRHVEMLNIFYVAITRAEEGLWMWALKPNKPQFKTMSDAIIEAMDIRSDALTDSSVFIGDWQSAWDKERLRFTYGEILENQGGKTCVDAIVLKDYALNLRDQKLRYHHPDAFLNLSQDEIIQQKTTMGSIAHEVLEYCQKADDLDAAIDRVVRSGRLDKTAGYDLKMTLEQAMEMPEVRDWFYGDYQVLAEREILMPNGDVIKPDRVMIKGNCAIIVDYKFGKVHHSKYQKQLEKYASAIQEMGYDKVDAYLWYVPEGQVIGGRV